MPTGDGRGKKGRPQRPLDPGADPIQRFAYDLRQIRPPGLTYRKMAERVHYSAQTLSAAVNGRQLPSQEVTRAFVQACGGDTTQWEQRWLDTQAQLQGSGTVADTGTPLHKNADETSSPTQAPQPVTQPTATQSAEPPHQQAAAHTPRHSDPEPQPAVGGVPAVPVRQPAQGPHRRRNRGLVLLTLGAVCIALVIWQRTGGSHQSGSQPQPSASATTPTLMTTTSGPDANLKYSVTLGPGCGMVATGTGGTHRWSPVKGLQPTLPGCGTALYTKDSGSAAGAGPWLAWAEWTFHPKPGQRCILSVYIPDTPWADTKQTQYEVFADIQQRSLLGRFYLNQAVSHNQWIVIGNQSGVSTSNAYTASTDTLDLTITDAAPGHAFLVADLAKATCT